MAENAVYTISKNTPIARDVYKMRLMGPVGAITAPGQFVNIKVEGFYLRRPISVCSWDPNGIELVYKVVGQGTARMAQFAPGTQLDILTGLGNGFSTDEAKGERVVLVGGGVGVPPLYGLAQKLASQQQAPLVVLGFLSAQDVFYTEEFEKLGCRVLVSTQDGTAGTQGLVTNILEQEQYTYYYTCGPLGMLQAVHQLSAKKGAKGQLSFEEKMGCGFGACMGCSCQTLVGSKRVCKEGPVFSSEEVKFQ